MRSKGAVVNLSDLQEAMNQLWHTFLMTRDGDWKRTILEVKDDDSQTGVACYRCTSATHKAYKCTQPQADRILHCFHGKYNKCKTFGHKAKQCFVDPTNDDIVPEWYKKQHIKRDNNEQTGLSEQDIEMVMMAHDVDFPLLAPLLQDPLCGLLIQVPM